MENDTASEQVPTSPSNQLDYTSTDPGCWGCIKEAAREYWIEKGPLICQNRNADFSASEKQYKHQKMSFSKSLFTRKLANGESVSREWMLYSPSKGCAFCFVCLLFSEKKDSPFSSCGFNDWKHTQQRVAEHESSESHHRCMLACGHLELQRKGRSTTNYENSFRQNATTGSVYYKGLWPL